MRTSQHISREQGAALMVAMVMIFVMSLLGVSAMRSGTMETRMVANAFEKDLTFQAAESATDFIIADDAKLEDVICQPSAVRSDVNQLESGAILETIVDVSYGGESVAIGYSLDSGFTAMRFIASGRSTLVESGTASRITQGVFLIGAKSSTGGC